MKKNIHKMLNSVGKGCINFCLAYGIFIITGQHSFICFGEPEFPEI